MAWHPGLKPEDGSNVRPPKLYSVADIEARDWVGFLVIGWYSRDTKQYRYFTKLRDFFTFIFTEANPSNQIYFHNGGRYDFLFLLNEMFGDEEFLIHDMLPRGSSLLCFSLSILDVAVKDGKHYYSKDGDKLGPRNIAHEKDGVVYYKARTIQFLDSISILPFSLASLTENFHVEHKKKEIDYNAISEVNEELLEYLKYDCIALSEVIEKYQEWPLIKKAGTAFTMASQALKVFQTFLKEEIRSLPDRIDEFIRPAYFGGRTEIFKPLFMPDIPSPENRLHCFDVNSLYPTVMRENRFPTNFKYMTDNYDPDVMGVFEATVEVPHDMYIPPLGTVVNIGGSDKFIFPVGRFSGKWTTIELEYARSLGVKIISTGQGAVFHDAGYIFKEYIDELYKIRENSRKDSVDNVLAKLLMNSCYGRMGLRRDREEILFDDGQDGVKLLAEIKKKDGSYIRLATRPKNLDKSFSNVAIALWVTSLSRIYMHKIYMQKPEEIYYTDTDSLFTTHVMESDNKLGGVKLEYSADGACFLLPKTYLIHSNEPIFKDPVNPKGGKINKKVVMKGFSREAVKDITVDDFTDAFEGELRLLRKKQMQKEGTLSFKDRITKDDMELLKVLNPGKGIMTFRTALGKKQDSILLKVQDNERAIRSLYDKREIYRRPDGFYDTRPLLIRDGELIDR